MTRKVAIYFSLFFLLASHWLAKYLYFLYLVLYPELSPNLSWITSQEILCAFPPPPRTLLRFRPWESIGDGRGLRPCGNMRRSTTHTNTRVRRVVLFGGGGGVRGWRAHVRWSDVEAGAGGGVGCRMPQAKYHLKAPQAGPGQAAEGASA